MRLRLYSDLHNEFDVFEIPKLDDEADTILLLAGDIGVARKHKTYAPFLRDAADRFRAVIYVPGNHEYYASSWEKAWADIQDMTGQFDNLHYLNKGVVEYDDVTFIGATLWTDFNDRDERVMDEAGYCMNDYHSIKRMRDGQYVGKLMPFHTYDEHQQARKFISDELAKASGRTTVVVTHHGPSFESVSPGFEGDLLNGAYMSDLESLMIEHEPNLWVHGHVHSSHDYHVGKTRVKTNPRGYFQFNKDQNKEFDDKGGQLEISSEKFSECDRCKNPAEELHTCPFNEEIDDDYETLCNCCFDCTNVCCEDI